LQEESGWTGLVKKTGKKGEKSFSGAWPSGPCSVLGIRGSEELVERKKLRRGLMTR
jgi:hypothetical protein